jgi:hypothetical protein
MVVPDEVEPQIPGVSSTTTKDFAGTARLNSRESERSMVAIASRDRKGRLVVKMTSVKGVEV